MPTHVFDLDPETKDCLSLLNLCCSLDWQRLMVPCKHRHTCQDGFCAGYAVECDHSMHIIQGSFHAIDFSISATSVSFTYHNGPVSVLLIVATVSASQVSSSMP
jgi:hypothetical protein